MTGKVATDIPRDLERDGSLRRTAYNQMPPVNHELTAIGRTLREPHAALGRWAETHIDEVASARAAYYASHPR